MEELQQLITNARANRKKIICLYAPKSLKNEILKHSGITIDEEGDKVFAGYKLNWGDGYAISTE